VGQTDVEPDDTFEAAETARRAPGLVIRQCR
jgi:hypothetical protein